MKKIPPRAVNVFVGMFNVLSGLITSYLFFDISEDPTCPYRFLLLALFALVIGFNAAAATANFEAAFSKEKK